MSTQIAIPGPFMPPPPFPVGQVLDPENREAVQYHAELQAAARNFRNSIAKIAYYGFRMRMCEGWIALGYEAGPRGEEAYRDALDIPRSTYYKAVRIGQSLHQLSLADLERIPTSNAELLIQVEPSIIHDHAWVTEAKTVKPKQFAELVAARNKTVGGREPLAAVHLKVPFLAKAAIEEMLESFQDRHELSSKGQALELMIADLHQDSGLLTAVQQARQLIGGVLESMARRKGANEDEKTWLTMAKEVLDAGYEKALQGARQKTQRGQGDGGRA